MTFKLNSFGAWAGGKPMPNLAKSLGAFSKFSQLKDALLRPGVGLGATAMLVGRDNLEICSFCKGLDPSAGPEVVIFSGHIYLSRLLEDSFEIGPGMDIEAVGVGGPTVVQILPGQGLKTDGGAHVFLNFAGHLRGPGLFVSADASVGMDLPGIGDYFGCGFAYNSKVSVRCGGASLFPEGWHRCGLGGDAAYRLTATAVVKEKIKIADIHAIADSEEFSVHLFVFRAYGDRGSASGGAWRMDGSDNLAIGNFTQTATNQALSFEDRTPVLVSDSGGAVEILWRHCYIGITQKPGGTQGEES